MAARKRYVALDGLRGVAALAVLFYHVEIFFTHSPLFRHGYLGVDFFFVLSGFVIGAAYEDRFSERSLDFSRFIFEVRAVRLYPLLIIATAMGLAFSLLNWERVDGAGLKMFVQQLLFVPAVRMGGAVYPLNNTQWSLGFEVVANVAHFILLRRLGLRGLGAIAAFSALALVALTWGGMTIDGGNGISTLAIGLARIGWSYTAGLIIYRLHRAGLLQGVTGGWWMGALIVLMATCAPTSKGSSAGYVQDLLSALVGFPLVVCLALRPIGIGIVNRSAEWIGELSYPLYILQSPIVDTLRTYAKPLNEIAKVAFGGIAVLLIFALSWALLRGFDEPIRKEIGRRLKLQRSAPAIMAP